MQTSSHSRSHSGPMIYVVPSNGAGAGSSTPVYNVPRQPFSIVLGRSGKIEVTYEQRTAKPVISVSNGGGHSSRREERPHESSSKRSRSPRSDVATIGSTTYMHSSSTEHRDHKSSTPRHSHHELPSSSRTPKLSSNYLQVPTVHEYDRQRRHSSAAEERRSKPMTISHKPTASPEKHAHFSLPHSAPAKSALPERVSPHSSPRQPSRHHHSHSQDSYFREAPKGWYNRRGDQYVEKGLIRRQPQHLEWHPVFAGYPEPGDGWMNENRQRLAHHGGILKH